jgi:hypothetical protein
MNGRRSAEWRGHVGASEARDAVAVLLPLFKGEAGRGSL